MYVLTCLRGAFPPVDLRAVYRNKREDDNGIKRKISLVYAILIKGCKILTDAEPPQYAIKTESREIANIDDTHIYRGNEKEGGMDRVIAIDSS